MIVSRVFSRLIVPIPVTLILQGLASPTAADLKQEILDLTNGIRAKAVWVRCDPSQSLDDLYNRGSNSILMGVSSDDGIIRTIDATRGNHSFPLISRTGEYVIWNNDPAGSAHAFGGSDANTVSWVCKWDGTGRQKLLDGVAGDPGFVFCLMLDDRTNQEWAYTGRMGGNSTVIYRYPFSAGVVDKSKRETVCTVESSPIPVLVSAQGKYLGGNFPWPNAFRIEASGCKVAQLNQTDDWSCWAQVAPDLSGRAAHMKDDHANIQVYSLTTAQGAGTLINLNKNIPGNRGASDCAGYRWSNHPQFLSSSYPLGIDTKPLGTPKFCIGRFNTAFTAVEKWVALPDSSSRSYNDLIGDFWLANGQGLASTAVSRRQATGSLRAAAAAVWTGRAVTVSVSAGAIRGLRVWNAEGRIVLVTTFSGNITRCAFVPSERGVHLVNVLTDRGAVETRCAVE